jgi:hypothetical protein
LIKFKNRKKTINPTKILEIAVPIRRLIGNAEIKKIGKIIANFL